MGVEVVIEEAPGWRDIPLEALANEAAAATLLHLGLAPKAWEVAVLGCGNARIATLNEAFRGKARPTNVLSWPSQARAAAAPGAAPAPPDADEPDLGDIAIAWETCAAEAREAGRPLGAHVTHLLVHGVLHLLGYDHEADADAAVMERLEVEILATLGVPDPYS